MDEVKSLPIKRPLNELLAEGGDSRAVIAQDSTNTYRCSTFPRHQIIPFGSCTASNISERGYAAAKLMLNRLHAVDQVSQLDITVEECHRSIRSELKFLLTRGKVDKLNVVLTPSGTDAELIPCLLASMGHDRDICNIVIGPMELGSGTCMAASFRYFDELTPSGMKVKVGEPVNPTLAGRINLYRIPVRDSTGTACDIDTIDRQVIAVVKDRIEAQGLQVLLHVTAHSKTGAHAPSLEVVEDLKREYKTRLDVVVDAAQGRFSRRGLIRVLEQGFLVIVTGSKFYGGPAFAGAVLVPKNYLARIEAMDEVSVEVAKDLCAFFRATQFPVEWSALRSVLPPQGNIGLLLRWSAAIEEMRAYYAVPSHLRLLALRAFEAILPKVLADSACIHLDAVSPAIVSNDYERLLQSKKTVFSFRLWSPENARYFTSEELRSIFHWMDIDLSDALPNSVTTVRIALAVRIQIGQPVELAGAGSESVAVLRIANGGIMITKLAEDLDIGESIEDRFRWLEDQCISIKRKLEVLALNFSEISQFMNGVEGTGIRCAHHDLPKRFADSTTAGLNRKSHHPV